MLGYADIFFADCFIQTLKYFPFYRQIMCEFSPKPSYSEHLIPDYDIKMKYDYWSSNKSDYGSTSFVESEIIGMESFHKLNIPLIHLKTRSEKENQEEREYDCKIKNNSNAEFDSTSIFNNSSITSLEPNNISVTQDTDPSTSNMNIGNAFSFGFELKSKKSIIIMSNRERYLFGFLFKRVLIEE